MYYKEACEMLGVNETDSLEDIRSKVKEMLKLIKGSYLDFNDYKVKFMIDDINGAFDYICKNYDNVIVRKVPQNHDYLTISNFISKYKKDSFVRYYMYHSSINFYTLYEYYYKQYRDICFHSGRIPMSIYAWLADFDKANTYRKNIFGNDANYDIHKLFEEYSEAIIYLHIPFSKYILDTAVDVINEHKKYKINAKTLEKHLTKYLRTKPNESFMEYLDQIKIGYSKVNVDKTISKVLQDKGFDNVSDEELIEVLHAVSENPKAEKNQSNLESLRSTYMYQMILIYVAKHDNDTVELTKMLNKDIDYLVSEYVYSEFFNKMSFKDYLSLMICTTALEKSGNKDAVLGIINEENNKMKLRLTDKEK